MNNFKVTKSGRYFRTELIRFEPANFTIKYAWSTSQLHENRKETELYMKFVLKMEEQVKKELKTRGLDFEPLKVVVHALKNVESWSGSFAFDIRHNIGIEKQADLITNWYANAWIKAADENDVIFQKISANGKGGYEHSKKSYTEDELYKRNKALYELDCEDLDEYYGEDLALKRMNEHIESTRVLIEKMDKEREEAKKKREDAMKGIKKGDKVLIPASAKEKKEPTLPAVVERLLKNNIVKVKVHSKLKVKVPLSYLKFDK
jgi:hypothetical protein